ncbi:MAG: NAD(P)-dependent oxidoreductase [Bacteroidales bacterium]|nr:NAD(P)-dependent oxidoreductase [Bacteroidales bacterium]
MKIIITGATGSLGAVLTRYFAKNGHEVIATGQVQNPPANLLKYADYLQTDIRNEYNLPVADLCIHTAALSDDKGIMEDLNISNIKGTIYTLKAAAECPVFIHISSSSVYLPSDTHLKEDIAGHQNNKQLSPYGYSKLKAEEALMKTCKNPSCFVLRPRAHYGPGDKMILPRILKLVKNDCIKRPGKMEVNVSMTHYDNVIHAIECCIASKKTGINIYNVADDQDYVFIDIIRKLTEALYNHPLAEKQIPISLLKFMSWFKIHGMTSLLVRSFTKNMVLDISKLKRELNYQPKRNFYEALPELKAWVERVGGVEIVKTGEKRLAWEE